MRSTALQNDPPTFLLSSSATHTHISPFLCFSHIGLLLFLKCLENLSARCLHRSFHHLLYFFMQISLQWDFSWIFYFKLTSPLTSSLFLNFLLQNFPSFNMLNILNNIIYYFLSPLAYKLLKQNDLNVLCALLNFRLLEHPIEAFQ